MLLLLSFSVDKPVTVSIYQQLMTRINTPKMFFINFNIAIISIDAELHRV